MAQSITTVTAPDGVSRVTTRGGIELSVVGVFTVGALMRAYLGTTGSVADEPCYFGPGLGYTGGSSADGTTVTVVSPILELSGSVTLTIVVDGDTLTKGGIAVIEHPWPKAVFSIRRNFPPWAAVGRRSLDLEDIQAMGSTGTLSTYGSATYGTSTYGG